MIPSVHAKERMLKKGISEDEIQECVEHGSFEFRDFVKGEIRIGKKLESDDKTFIVVYTVQQEQKRIITVYRLRRKKWQEKTDIIAESVTWN